MKGILHIALLYDKSSDASRIIVVMLILICWRFGQKKVSTKCMLTLCDSVSNRKITLQSIVVLSTVEAKNMGITKIVKKIYLSVWLTI